MTQTAEDPDLAVIAIPTGWMVTGRTYPRITVLAETREAALEEFSRSRAAWLKDAATA